MDNNLKYKKCLVASVDVLGIKKKLQGEDAVNLLDVLHHSFSEVIDEVKELDKQYFAFKQYKFKVFSDNIAIVHEVDDDSSKIIHINNLADFISQFQSKLWCYHGLLSRGGIAYGDCFIDDMMVFGKGLVEAYQLESEIAIYPRVVISPDLIKYANFIGGKYYSRDTDGYFYVDYMSFWNKRLSEEKNRQVIEQIKRCLAEEKDSRVAQKYSWLLEKAERTIL